MQRLIKWFLIFAIPVLILLAAFNLNFGGPPLPEPSPKRALIQPASQTLAPDVIADLQVKVSSFQFYEDKGNNEVEFKSAFTEEQARHMGWELCLEYSTPNAQIDLPLSYTLLDPKGKLHTASSHTDTVDAGATSSCHRRSIEGVVLTGNYRLEVYFDDVLLATGSFKVIK
jgi:hypothetical protein